MTGAILNADNFFEDRPEILAVCRGECSRDVFPHHVSRSNKVSWYISPLIRIPHFFYDSYLFHEQAGAFSRKPLTFPGHG